MSLPTLKSECATFLKESNGLPLFKSLPSGKEGFIRIKARHRKSNNEYFESAFNGAFSPRSSNMLPRSIFCSTYEPKKAGYTNYYIFPIDGYRFLYSKNGKNTSETYLEALTTLLDMVTEAHAVSLLTTILADDYTDEDFSHGLSSNKEIIIYSIPYFYGVRCDLFPGPDGYKKLIQ